MIRKMTLIALLLSGCSAIDHATTAMLERQNPLTADPAKYTVVIGLPPGLGLEQNGATIGLDAQFRDQAISEKYHLRQTGLSDGGIALAIKPEDVPKLRAMQAKVAAWEQESPADSTGSLTAMVSPCYTGLPVPENGKVSISIRTREGGPLMPLLRPYSAQKLVKRIETDAGAPLPRCGTSVER
ncbi:hypothetical protein [Thalassococcus lentus]|uniref:Lipoprotein n=1 Tax=Thalassococcus lentus TaxID=1210524 RepID=A0ABT4XSZ3_9RHOB|nr:hypothetical protein [Thalassococcus lentus]MDA7425050.1 hypothetical protein [Thalassococcus lentus]